MNKNEKKVKKVHVGRCLLALLLCLGVIIPVIGGVMLATSTYFVVQAEGEKEPEVTYPTAEEVGGPGAQYWKDFVEEHPDAALHEATNSDPVTTVGNDGGPMDPGWFNVKIKLMGNRTYEELFALGNELNNGPERAPEGTKFSNRFLWNAKWEEATSLEEGLASPTGANMTLIYPDVKANPNAIKEWKGPKSGGMRWNDLGFVLQGTDYPELYVPFSPQAYPPANMNYGINAAYVGNTRVYNVGTITTTETKEKADGEKEVTKATHLWVALDKAGDNIVVLPEQDVTELVTLVYGPVEYHVNYKVTLDGVDITQLAETEEGRAKLIAAWGIDKVQRESDDDPVDGILDKVFGYMQDVTKGQTVTNTVTIPDPGHYGRVYYYYGGEDNEGNALRVERYPEGEYGNYPLGTEVRYSTQHSREVTGYVLLARQYTDIYWTEVDTSKGPSRYSFSESYSLGDPGTANDDVTVLVEVSTRDAEDVWFDYSTLEGYGNSNGFPNTYNESSVPNDSNGDGVSNDGRGKMARNADGTYTWEWTLTKTENATSAGFKTIPLIEALALNDVDLDIAWPTDNDLKTGVGETGSSSSNTKTYNTEAILENEDGKEIGFVKLEVSRFDQHLSVSDGGGLRRNNRTQTYKFTVTLYEGNQNLTVTDYVEAGRTRTLFGYVNVRTAEGVDVQLRRATYYFSVIGVFAVQTSNDWKSVPLKGRMLFGFTDLLPGFHFNSDKKDVLFDAGDSNQYKYLSSEGYNVRIAPQAGYALQGMNKAGVLPETISFDEQHASFTYTTGTLLRQKTPHTVPLTITPVKELDNGKRWYGSLLDSNLKPAWPNKQAYLDFKADLISYEIQYRSGFNSDNTPQWLNEQFRSGKYDGDTFKDFSLVSTSMPFNTKQAQSGGNPTGNTYDPFTYSLKKGYDFVTVSSAVPQDDKGGATFRYWVLTNAAGKPVDMDGREVTEQADWITFETADSFRLQSNFGSFIELAKTSAAGGYFTNGSETIIRSTDDEANGYTFTNKYVFYLTAYWNEPLDPYTNFVSANTRADEVKGEEELWFEGSVYEDEFGTKRTDYLDPEDEDYPELNGKSDPNTVKEGTTYEKQTDGETPLMLIRSIATMHTSLSFADLFGRTEKYLPLTINKDNIIHNLNQYQKDNHHYEWYTLDDEKNNSYYWEQVGDMDVVDIWFLDTAGSLTINNTVAGYDLPNGLPFKITLIPPVYTETDEYGQPLAKPVDTDGDGFVDAYNLNDNRFTYIDEEAYFAGEWVKEVGWIEVDENGEPESDEDAYKHGHVYGHFAGAAIPVEFSNEVAFFARNNGDKDDSDRAVHKDGSGYKIDLTQTCIGKTEAMFNGETYTTQRYVYSAVVYMKSGESITFPKLPQGTTYRIELLQTNTANREYSDGYEFAVEEPETSQGLLLDDRRVWTQANYWGLEGQTNTVHELDYEAWQGKSLGQPGVVSERGTSTRWDRYLLEDEINYEDGHRYTKDHFAIEFFDENGEKLKTKEDEENQEELEEGEEKEEAPKQKITLLQSAKYYIDGNDKNTKPENVVLGINAYDTQVIDMVVKGTYTIYLDQYTSAQEADQENEGNWTAADDKGELEVQNFDYLSYVATARNLTNKSQTLKITLKVDTKFLFSGDPADRRLAISKINGDEQEWNPQDFENQTVDDSAAEPGEELEETPVGAAEELEEEQEETDTIVKSGETKVKFEGKGENGEDLEVTAKWEYDFENASIIYTVPNVPSGEEVTLTVRTTVPAVNAATDYYASATLEPIDDEDVESLDSNDVSAYVFSNWLRIVARIGSESYNLTPTDEQQVFTYKVTLTETKDDPDHSVSQLIHFMKFDNTSAYGTEHKDSTQWTARVLASGETEEDLGEYEVELKVNEKGDTTEYYFYVELKHGERVVIYDMLTEPRVDEDGNVPSEDPEENTPEEEIPEEVPEETPDGDGNGDATEEQDPAPTEAIHQIGYTVEWTADKGNKTAQDAIYSVYSYGLDGGKREDNIGHDSTEKANDVYTGTIEDGVDMVVYVYMPSNDLTVSKVVEGKDDDLDRVWKFEATFENGELALYKQYGYSFAQMTGVDGAKSTDDTSDAADKVNTIDYVLSTVTETADDGTVSTKYILTATFYLKHGQQITIESLPQGTTYSIKEGPALADNETAPSYSGSYVLTDGNVTAPDTDGVHGPYDYDKDEGMTGGSIYVNQKSQNDKGEWVNVEDMDAEVEEGQARPFKKATNAVAFTNKMSGDLVITKIVPGHVAADSTNFTFEVTLKDANGNAVTEDIAGLTKTDVEGVYTVTMTSTDGAKVTEDGANQGAWVGTVTIKDLPNGTEYAIEETSCGTEHDTHAHYTSSWDTTKKKTGTIDEPINEAICINEKTGKLTLKKEVAATGDDTINTGSRIDKFTFTITLKDSAGDALSDTYTVDGHATIKELTFVGGVAKVQLAHGESISIEGLPADATYTIVEADEGGYTTTIDNNGVTVSNNKTATGAVALWSDNDGTTVTYTNSRSGSTPGGILLNFLWAIPLLLVAIGGVTAIVLKNRKRAAI